MIEVGRVFKDNDPRMKGRLVVITAVDGERLTYRAYLLNGAHGPFAFKGQARRFHLDGKPRRTGFSFVS